MQGLPALHRLLASLVRTWVIAVVAVIACAVFAAHAVASFIAADVLTDSPQAKLPPAPPAPATPPTTKTAAKRTTDGIALVERNIFCSECTPTVDPGGDPADPQYAGAPATLIATSLGGDDPSCTVHVLSTDVQGSWNLGDKIPGVGTIAKISPTSIEVVDAHNHRGRLSLLDSAAGRTAGAATPVASAPAATPRPFADSINKINDTTYEVKRALVRTLVSGGSNGGGVRAMPFTEKGEIKGIRLFGVKPESVAGELGLKSSDVISTIDGEPIKNVQQLLDLYAKLDNLDNVELGGTRAGKPITLALRLR